MAADHVKAKTDRLEIFDKIFNLSKLDTKAKNPYMNDQYKDTRINSVNDISHNKVNSNNNDNKENAKTENDFSQNDIDPINKSATKLLKSNYVTNPIFKTFIKATNLPVETKSMITILDMERKATEKPKTIEFEETKDINIVSLLIKNLIYIRKTKSSN